MLVLRYATPMTTHVYFDLDGTLTDPDERNLPGLI